MTPFPRVKDLTQVESRVTVETDGSGAYDLLLTIWSAFDDDEDHSSFELGKNWFEGIVVAVRAVDLEFESEIRFLGGPGGAAWLGIGGLVAASTGPRDIDSMLAWLADIDPIELRSGILMHKCSANRDESFDLARQAAAGDRGALESFLTSGQMAEYPEAADCYRELFDVPMSELRDRIVAALVRFRDDVYRPYEDNFSQASARAAAARRALARGADPERVIEEVTNGLDYRIPAGVNRLVLVPSVVLRPWALIDQHLDTLAVAYPVPDEFLDNDADAPPSWMVKLHKALGDERRLRILRRLSQGPAGLEDLADLLGLSKSTVHHHVGLLRAAGLVRVRLDTEANTRHYTLRPAVLPEARRTLDDYLGTTQDDYRSER